MQAAPAVAGAMLAETIPESEFAQANSVLAETAAFFLQASRSFTVPVFCVALLPVGARNSDTSPRQRYLHPCLLIQLSRCNYSSANHPGDLLSVWEFTLRDCCAIMATIAICSYCCRRLNVSNLRFRFVWRIYKIYFSIKHCRNEDQK